MNVSPPKRGRLRRALGELFRSESDPVPWGPAPNVDMADYPPPYPSGWYRVANSADLKPGELQRVQCLGEELVVYRGSKSGQVYVVDAYCPHQGADLAVGGKVEGDRLRCAFHHWEFGADGCVAKIPNMNGRKLPKVRLGSWVAREYYGMVWIWRGCEGSRDEAAYQLPGHEAIDSGELIYRGEHDAGTVDMHLIEFAENSVDFQHFTPLHGHMLVPWTRIQVPGVTIRHDPSWAIDDELPHVTYFGDKASLEFLGRPIPKSNADAMITICGPGGIVWFRFDIPGLGKITMFQTHTPVAPRRQQIYFRWFAEPKLPRPLVAYVVGSWISNWRADIAIWETKVYRRKPQLCRLDGPIHKMRKWYGQFYDKADAREAHAAGA